MEEELSLNHEEPRDGETERPSRPFYVWLIFIYFVLTGAYAIVLTTLLLTGVFPLDEDLLASDYFFIAVFRTISVLYIAAGVTLFLYRKVSFKIFLAAIAITVAINLYYLISTGEWIFQGDELMFYLPEWAILAISTIYAWKLTRDGYLK